MNSNRGYVYIMINPSYQGLVKIGKTTKEPEDRAKELSSATGVATPFVVVYHREFNNCHKAEQNIHSILEEKGFRINNSREFFSISIPEAITLLMSLPNDEDDSDVFEDTCYEVESNGSSLAEEYFSLGKKYYNGSNDTFQDEEMAIYYFEKSANLGHAEASYYLGSINHYSRENDIKAKQYLLEAASRGYWRSYSVLASIFGSLHGPLANDKNRDLAWQKYFENLKANIKSLDAWDWNILGVGREFIDYLYNLLWIQKKDIPDWIQELAYENRNYLNNALQHSIDYCVSNGYESLADIYKKTISPFLASLEENYLLSHGDGVDLGINYYTLAEKYLFGLDKYEKNLVKAINLLKSSEKLGYIRASVLLGYCWLTKQMSQTASKVWKSFYNGLFDKTSGGTEVDEAQKTLILECFFEMYKYAIDQNSTEIVDSNYIIYSVGLGLLEYIEHKANEVIDTYDKIEQMPTYDGDAELLTTDQLCANLDKRFKAFQTEQLKDSIMKVFNFVRDYLHKLQEQSIDNIVQCKRLSDD